MSFKSLRVASFASFVVACAAIGCSSSSNNPGADGSPSPLDGSAPQNDGKLFEITGGTFNALTLAPLDGFAAITVSATGAELIVIVADRAMLCAAGASRQNETVFSLDALSDNTAFAPGTYTQKAADGPNAAGEANVAMSKLGAMCGGTGSGGMDYYGDTGSTVVITSVTATTVSGTFNITLANAAGTLEGSFNVPICSTVLSTKCMP